LGAASRVLGDARRDYLDGLLAYREGRLAEAVTALERATAERPREEARARLVGAIPEPYLPWHYLGLARARQGRCDAALEAWARSAEDGVVTRLPERAQELAAARSACPTSATAATADPRPVPTATVQDSAPPPEPALESRPAEPKPAEPSPTREPEADRQVPPAKQVPGTSSKPAMPRFLEEAAERFAEGDYRGTLAALETLPTETPSRERALADLLIAAASFSLHELGGRSDSGLLERATVAARRARSAAPDLHPDATVFAPRFVDWFESLR
jgi:hypothetical protein